MKQGIAYSWEFLASVLAEENSDEQVKFFKAFVKEMDSWRTTFQKQTQMFSINAQLNDHEREILECLAYKENKS